MNEDDSGPHGLGLAVLTPAAGRCGVKSGMLNILNKPRPDAELTLFKK